jgi:riboflavin kinase/FMN adenylyltransferase
VSSGAIRTALGAGRVVEATELLGAPWFVSGEVIHGDKRGRTLGFPTANLPLRHPPALTGIFAVRVHGLGAARPGVASVGVRPTIASSGMPVAEVYLFDFGDSIYGRRITVEFLHKLRDETRFPNLDALTRQIDRDVVDAREYFAAQG